MPASISDKLKSTWNSAAPAPTNPSASRAPGASTLACTSLNWPTDTAVDFATFGKNADGSVNQASVQEFTAIVSGNNLTGIVLTSGGSDQGNDITDIVVMKPTSKGHQDLVDAMKVTHNQDGSLKDNIVTTAKITNGAVTSDTLAQSAKDALGSYSTSETATPFKWVDGRTVYKKSWSGTDTLPSAHGITSLEDVLKIEAMVKDGSGMWRPIPWGFNAGSYAGLDPWIGGVGINSTSLTWQLGSSISVFVKSRVTLYYTKT